MNVFVAGARAIVRLDSEVLKRLENICNNQHTVLVGDANGVDSAVQKFFFSKNYKKVIVFATNGRARNNLGNWQIENVPVNGNIRGFDFYAAKDIQMANLSDCGLMIWNGESRGTFNNIINLVNQNKNAIIYFTPKKEFYTIKNSGELDVFIKQNVILNSKLENLILKPVEEPIQLQLTM